MSIRQTIGIGALLCACVVWRPAAGADPTGNNTPQRPLAFEVAAAAGASVECLVDFGPALPISAVDFSPDGNSLAVGGYKEVLLWDLQQAKLAARIGAGQLSGMVHAVAFTGDGKALAVGDGVPHRSGAVRIFNAATGQPTAALDGPQRVVCCLAPSPDGKLLAAGDAGSLVHVWSFDDGRPVKTLDGHNGWVLGAAFSADGKRLATAGADNSIQVWDTQSWELIIRYDVPATVNAAVLSPDGKMVVGAVGGPDEWAMRIGRIDTDLQQAARRKPAARAISTGTGMPLDIIWPVKGTNVFVSCHDHTVRAYQGTNGRPITTYSGHTDWVYCVAATGDGSKLASGGADGTVKLWDGAGGRPLATLVQLSPGTDEWLIMTREGHFAASSAGLVRWKTNGLSASAEELTDSFHDPDQVRQALTAKTRPPFAFRPRRPPKRRPGQSPKKNP